MKKIKILSVISVVFFMMSCNTKQDFRDNKKDNANVFGDVTYEISLEKDVNRPSWLDKLDKDKFVDFVINKVLSGEWNAYSYFYYDKLSIDALKQLCVTKIDSVYEENANTGKQELKISKTDFDKNSVKSVLFIEEWGFNADTKRMEKQIKAVGLVVHTYVMKEDQTEETQKQVLFVVYFDEKDVPVAKS